MSKVKDKTKVLQIKRMGVGIQMEERQLLKDEFITNYNVRKEIKCCGDSEILHGLVHDTTQISL